MIGAPFSLHSPLTRASPTLSLNGEGTFLKHTLASRFTLAIKGEGGVQHRVRGSSGLQRENRFQLTALATMSPTSVVEYPILPALMLFICCMTLTIAVSTVFAASSSPRTSNII